MTDFDYLQFYVNIIMLNKSLAKKIDVNLAMERSLTTMN